eukprot:3129627-Rhodomonas_salina.2
MWFLVLDFGAHAHDSDIMDQFRCRACRGVEIRVPISLFDAALLLMDASLLLVGAMSEARLPCYSPDVTGKAAPLQRLHGLVWWQC